MVRELEEELRLGVESLAMEYSSMFSKELNMGEEMRQMNALSHRKNESSKRK